MAPSETTSPYTVLIADDDPTILLLLEHVLEGMGRRFEMADDGVQAWAAWQRSRHELVVLEQVPERWEPVKVAKRKPSRSSR